MLNFNNIIMLSDSYKVTHWKQLPPGTTHAHSYLESRGGKYDRTVFFGLQYFLKQYLSKPITQDNIEEADYIYGQHLGPGQFNREGWEHILKKHDGFLPLRIKAVNEGSIHPVHTPLVTVENTDERVPWLTNYVETPLVQVWYPCTVATQSFHMREILKKFYRETSDGGLVQERAYLDYGVHDFGFRGVTSIEQAAIGGAAHLTSFNGTDNPPAMMLASEIYRDHYIHGKSIPASEHFTITSWGREHENDAMRNMLTQYPTGPVACVSDSFNIFNACQNIWGEELREIIQCRDGVLVIRPDSGPFTNLLTILDIIGQKFGYIVNRKGYKVINPKVRVIQGDGINIVTMSSICQMLKDAKWSIENMTFGSGGGLLQQMDRDTSKYAFKCSAVKVDGFWRDVYKDPITDPGKTSKRGRIENVDLTTVYENGHVAKNPSFQFIKNRIDFYREPVTCGSSCNVKVVELK